MVGTPYYIELRGGRFDGYRQGVEQMPLQTRIEIPSEAPGLLSARPASPRTAVYERRQVVLALFNHIPTMVLKYDYIAPPRAKAVLAGGSPRKR